MIYEKNINNLKNLISLDTKDTKLYHKVGKYSKFLPFTTNDGKLNELGVIGELVRLINNKKIKKNFNIEDVINDIVSLVYVENDEDKQYLNNLIREKLLNKDNTINIFHYKLYEYVEISNSNDQSTEEINKTRKTAEFLYDIIFKDILALKDLSNKIKDTDILTKIVLEGLDKACCLEDRDRVIEYENKLIFINELAIEDFNFLLKNEELFIKYFDKLVYFYYFYYLIQICKKINKRFNTIYEEVEEMYYLLEWEKASKNRKAVNKGYENLKDQKEYLWININLIEHLNCLIGRQNNTLVEIKDYIEKLEIDEKNNYLETMREWIKIYKKAANQEYKDINLDFYALVDEISNSLSEKMSAPGRGRRLFVDNIEKIGKQQKFLKYRGKYKFVFNLNKEMILMLTTVCVKEEKIMLKDLFCEYRKRGVFLDLESQEEVSNFLDKLNLIDKKSDSGDAQYVKSII